MSKRMKKIERTSMGLRDMLFDELDSLRNGETNAQQAHAVAKLTVQIINCARLDLDIRRMDNEGVSLQNQPIMRLGRG